MATDIHESPEFDPDEIQQGIDAFDRRTFLKLMGAAMAAAGVAELGGCTKPQSLEKIVPYVKSPENVIPGLPAFYASTLPTRGFSSGFGRGVIVESHEGRPTKIEGNPLHPSSLGSTDIFMQAAVLQLYDPDRSKTPLKNNAETAWEKVLADLSQFTSVRGGPEKIRIALLTSTLTSPALLAQLTALQTRFPKVHWFLDDPLSPASARVGQQRAIGRPVSPLYDFTKAARILSLDAHFLSEENGSLPYARQFAQSRRLPLHAFGPNQTHSIDTAPPAAFSRLYMAECSSTYTGAMADHRMAVSPSMMPQIAAALLRAVSSKNTARDPALAPDIAAWASAAAEDLLAHPGQSLVLAGLYQPPEVHAAAYALNSLLGSVGSTLHYLSPIDALPSANSSLADLTQALVADEFDLLLMLDVNPAYTAPADLRFPEVLSEFSKRTDHLALHHGAYVDETAILCTHHLPMSHPLESWSDLRAHDGTASLVQPLIEPLWQSRCPHELFAALITENNSASGYDILRNHWLTEWKDLAPADREIQWRKSLRDGFIASTAAAPLGSLPIADTAALLRDLAALTRPSDNPIELVFRPDPTISDGFFANHPWLQELPKPLTLITWDTVALLGPATAAALGIDRPIDPARTQLPMVQITRGPTTIELPAWIQPNHPEKTITLFLGGGRTAPAPVPDDSSSPVQAGVGVNVNSLRDFNNAWSLAASDLHIQKAPRRTIIACTQPTQFMSDRDVARSRPIAGLSSSDKPTPTAPRDKIKNVHLSLYNEMPYPGYKWGMVIDLSACIGCSACVIACQAENNIPTVGKEQVWRRREMQWLRIDTYYGPASAKSLDDFSPDAQIHFQPMLCQHCENAPCEVVCPVEATSHSSEGINEMTYNRCIGTRYCSNNCPYKVRRFNFLNYNYHDTETVTLESMQKNPNVTVRFRGVMEKCTYCIQRINRARIDAKRAWGKNGSAPELNPAPPMRDPAHDPDLPNAVPESLPRLSFQTACQQACPTEAIIFGDLNDANALVTKTKFSAPWQSINYGVLTDLNTQPRTSYLARLTNKNPALPPNGGAK